MERQPYKFIILEPAQEFHRRPIPRSHSEDFFDSEPYENDLRGSDDTIKVTVDDGPSGADDTIKVTLDDGPRGADDTIKVTLTEDYVQHQTIEPEMEEATYQTTRGPVVFQWFTLTSNVGHISRQYLSGLFGVIYQTDAIEAKWRNQFPAYLEHINLSKMSKGSVPDLINGLIKKFTADNEIELVH